MLKNRKKNIMDNIENNNFKYYIYLENLRKAGAKNI